MNGKVTPLLYQCHNLEQKIWPDAKVLRKLKPIIRGQDGLLLCMRIPANPYSLLQQLAHFHESTIVIRGFDGKAKTPHEIKHALVVL